MAEPSKATKKCRQYSVEYLKYGFISSPMNKQLPMCLVCEKTFSNESMKPSRLSEHLQKVHPDKMGRDSAYFQSLRDKFEKRKTLPSIFCRTSHENIDGLRALYSISRLIAKAGKPHTIGEQ